jgi:tetratricopeptide (TPR) repeat protein
MNQTLSVEDAIKHASVLFNQGEYQESENICRSILEVNSNNPDANHILGVIALRFNKYPEAISSLKKAIKSNKQNAEYHDSIGNAYKLNNDTVSAIKSFRKALSINNKIAKTHYNLANIYFDKKNFKDAKTYYKNSINLNPDYSQAMNNLSVIYRQEGEYKKSEELLLKIAALSPDNVIAINNLAINYNEAGEYDKSLNAYKKALSIKPDYFEAYYNIGNLYRLLDDDDSAIKSYHEALRIKPDFVEAQNNIAVAYMEIKDYSRAVFHFSEAIKINPTYKLTYINFANLYKKTGANDKARSLYEKAIEIDPQYMDAYYNLACLHYDIGRPELAIKDFKKAIELNSGFAPAYKNLGNVYKDLGDIDLAIDMFYKAIEINPAFSEAYRELTSVKKLDKDNAEFKLMKRMFTYDVLRDDQKVNLAFGLAKSYQDFKEYDEAFKYIIEANKARRRLIPYSPDYTKKIFSETKKIFTKSYIEKNQPFGLADQAPIFILGMPRSGSSLIEQILATHSQVYGAGELDFIDKSINKICSLPTKLDYPECLQILDESSIRQLAESYTQLLMQFSATEEYITDKMPQNFFYVGLIKIMFPNAKIIHSNRDAMDTCFSIYKHGFYEGHAYADDLNDLGEYYRLYEDLMQHWNNVLPNTIFEVKYENMVANQEDETKRLLEFCGLPWEENCLSFYKTKRKVHTASATQVRKGIYKDSVKLWKRYEKQLQPLKEALHYQE